MTQDHPAVVNLALVGSDSNNTNILNEQVHSFRYDVISNETGGSHKYTIELINYDDSFMGGLIDMYAKLMGSDGSLVDAEPIISGAENSAEASFPKLVIEWGYPGQMSGVHVAQISNIQYKYTQGKERILIIDATDVTEIFEIYTTNIVKTPNRKFSLEIGTTQNFAPSSASNPSLTTPVSNLPLIGLADARGAPIEFHEIIFQILRDLIGAIPGIHIEQLPLFEDYGFGDVMQSLVDGFINPNPTGSYSLAAAKAELEDFFGYYANDPARASVLAREEYYGHYANSVKKLFNYFGITFENPGFDKEAAKARGDRFISLETERVLENGDYGYATNVISSEQIVSNPNGLKALQHATAYQFPEVIDFNNTTNNATLLANLETRAYDYWTRVIMQPGHPPQGVRDAFKVSFEFSENDTNTFRKGETVRIAPSAYFYIDEYIDLNAGIQLAPWSGTFNIVPLIATDRAGVDIDANDRTATRGLIGPTLITLSAAKEKANQDLWAGGLSDAVIGSPEQVRTLTPGLTYEQLTETEQADLEYNNMKFYYKSEKGTDVMQSAQHIINKFNSLVPDGLEIGMLKESIRYAQSFTDIQDKVIDSAGDVPTTAIYLGNKTDLSRFSAQGLTPFNTERNNPRSDDLNTLMYTADPNTPSMLKLVYGGQGANVKYFDFASDHRYLANIVTSYVTVNTFNSFSEYLSAESIKNYLSPMLKVITNFWDYYSDQGGMGTVNLFNDVFNEGGEYNDELFDKNSESLYKMREEFNSITQAFETQLKGGDDIIPISDELFEIFSKEEFKQIIDFIVKDKLSNSWDPLGVNTSINGEDLSTRIKIFFGALSNASYVGHLFHKGAGKLKKSEKKTEEFIAEALMNYTGSSSLDPTVIELPAPEYENSFVYILQDVNPFDTAAALKIQKNLAVQMDFINRNTKDVVTLKVKTLGIPEMDTYREVSAPRRIEFKIENIKNSYVTNKYQHHSHWLSGYYNPLAISHTIDSKGGYSTEFKLIKENGSYGGLSGK